MRMLELNQTTSGYCLEYKEHNLSITASHIHRHRDNRITAELLFETNAPGYSPLLHQTQLNLLSTRSKQILAKEMEARYEAPWVEILEQSSALILDRIRRGEPLQYISTFHEIKPVEYLIHPLIPLNQPTAIFGLPGTMKSYISLVCGILSSLPWDDNPLGFKVVKEPSRLALYLDYESSRDLMSWRLKRLQAGMSLGEVMLPYRRCSIPLADDIDQVKKIIDESKASFIVIDSLGGACGGDVYSPDPALKFFAALRSLNMTSLVLAHTSKESSREKSILGTIYWTAYFRQIFEAKVSQEEGENEISCGLFHRKANEDRLISPIGLHFTFAENAIQVERQDVKGIEGFLEQLSLSQRILEILKEGAMTSSELNEILGTRRDTLRMTLNRLKGKGQVVKLPSEKWGCEASEITPS